MNYGAYCSPVLRDPAAKLLLALIPQLAFRPCDDPLFCDA
jgi:hypothetical protein